MKTISVSIILILFYSIHSFSQDKTSSDSLNLMINKIDSIVKDKYSFLEKSNKKAIIHYHGVIRDSNDKYIGFSCGYLLTDDGFGEYKIYYAYDDEYYKFKKNQLFYKSISKEYYFNPNSLDLVYYEEIIHHFVLGIKLKTHHKKYYFDSGKLIYTNQNKKKNDDFDNFLKEILNKYNKIEP